MLQVCKLVNQELLDLLYERMLFTVYITSSHLNESSPRMPPKLGLARDFHFWKRARRILLVSTDEDSRSIKDLIRTLGTGFRCFKSTPQDTTAFLYLHNELEFDVRDSCSKSWKRCLKSLASLSRRAELNFEFRLQHPVNAREEMLELVDATNGSATLVNVEYRHSGIPRAGSDEVVLSSERFRGGGNADFELGADVANKGRIVCLMSRTARNRTCRTMALKRRRERILIKKRLFEGRLG